MIKKPKKLNKFPAILHGLNWVVVVVIVVAGLGLVFAVVPWFGNTGLIVRSGSMQPAIGVGDLVVVRPSGEYRKGDVIAFKGVRGGETIVTHRISAIEEVSGEEVFTTKGDANAEADEALVKEAQIIGKQLVAVPYVGKVLSLGKTKVGFLAFVVVPALLVIISDVIAITRELRGRKKSLVDGVKEEVKSVSVVPKLSPVARLAIHGVRKLPRRVPVDSVVVKMAVLVMAIGLILPSGMAFYTDSEVSAGNTFTAASCFDTDAFADEVTEVVGTFGNCCSAASLSSDPVVAASSIVGENDSPPETNFIQISDDSSVTVRFSDNRGVLSGDSDSDLRIHTFDEPFPGEAEVLVSDDCATYFSVGVFSDDPVNQMVDIDADGSGVASIKCVRLVDQVEAGDPFPLLGFDLDAVEVLDSVLECEEL